MRTSFYVVNGITLYRVLASAVLLYLIIQHELEIFRWLLAISFFTDAIDGYLARKFKVASALGSKMDSIGDDLTVLMGIIGLIVFRRDFLLDHLYWIIALFIIFLVQICLALIRYRKLTSFHTYGAKIAAVCQGVFLILSFFLQEPPYILFVIAILVTALELFEEIFLILLLPQWQHDVKGLYWAIRQRKRKESTSPPAGHNK